MSVAYLMRNKNFIRIYLSGLTSYLSDAILQVALIAYIMVFGGNVGSSAAMIMFFFVLPSVLFAPLGGILADKVKKKKVLFTVNIFKLIVLLVIILLGKISSVQDAKFIAYLSAFLMGSGAAFFFPSYLSSIPNIVRADQLQKANSFTSGTVSLAILLGGVISGGFIVKYGAILTLSGCAFFYLFSAICAISIDVNYPTNQTTGSFIGDFKRSLNYLKNHRFTKNVVLLSFALATITASLFNLMNAIALDYYHMSMAGLSELKLMLGVGVISGSAIALFINNKIKLPLLLGGAFSVFLIALFTAGFANTMFKAWFWLVSVGIGSSLISITLDTLLQKSVPNSLRGKIFGVRSSISTTVFVTVTLIIAILIKTVDYFTIFKFVALFAGVVAFLILIFDKTLGYLVFRTTISSIFSLFYPVKVEGRDFIPEKGGVIFAGNHTGWLDSLILITAINRPVWFLAGPYAFQIPFIKYFINRVNVIPITPSHGEDGLMDAVKKIQRGDAVCIFPEGKLTHDGELNRFRKGVALLHKLSKAPIVPFVISGGYEAWSWNQKIPKLFKSIWVQFAQPLNESGKNDNEVADELQKRVAFIKKSLERRKINPWNPDNFLDVMQMKGDVFAVRKALSLKEKNGEWTELTYIELSRRAKRFANYLVENGIQRGDRIAILSESRPEFGIAFFASIQVGAITVPLDVKLTVQELTTILSDCKPCAICVSNNYSDVAIEVQKNIPSIKNIYVIQEKSDNPNLPSIFDFKPKEGDMGRPRALNETALIVYTSGTTGSPKGVMISFGNILSQMRDFETIFKLSQDETLLSILPINHLLELNVGFNGMLYMGAKICYVSSLNPKVIQEVMKERKVTYMIAVPLFIKLLKTSIEKKIDSMPYYMQFLINFLLKLSPLMPYRLKRLIFKKVHDAFGGELKGFISGGAPLDIEVAKFFDALGIVVYQGYGLTETSPTLTTNYPKNQKLGSVGKALPSVELKIAKNGEILARGSNLMQGYYEKPDLTKEVIDAQGWFHTGDVGYIDRQGYLYITGRIKNMIVLGGGKKVFPEEVEVVLENSPLIKEICVLALQIKSGLKAGREVVGAIVVPSDDLVLKSDNEIKIEIEKEIKRLSESNLASYKIPTLIVIHREELPKTSTKKIKRKDLSEWYDANF